jgi:hypothetical protein
MTDATALPASPLHALCVYAEPLVVGRRVVVFDDTRRRLGERFLEMGARVVHVYDPEPARALAAAARAPRGMTVLSLPSGDFDVREGAFDVAIVANVAELSSAASLMGRIRRLLAPGGAVLVRSAVADAGRAAGAPGTLDYYELYDLVALQFAHVHMVGQIPWAGVALAELGRDGEEPAVTVDTQLMTETLPPDAFIAVGSQEDIHLAEYALIQLPDAAPVHVEPAVAHGSERADLAAAQLRASLLEAQVEELRARRNTEGAAHADALGALEGELASRLSELQLAEQRTIQISARADRLETDLRTRDDDLARLRDRATLALKELEDERRLRSRAESALQAIHKSTDAGAGERAAALERASLETRAIAEVARLLEARVADLTRSLAASEDVRARVEAALGASLAEIEALREMASRDDGVAVAATEASARVDELEGALVKLEAEVFGLGDAHAAEVQAFEAALRERGRATHALERELERRERIILDLVHALEEVGIADLPGSPAPATEASASGADLAEFDLRREAALRDARAENEELRAKLDAAALEIARREGEATASAWRLEELEQTVARLEDEQSELTMTIPPPAFVKLEREVSRRGGEPTEGYAAPPPVGWRDDGETAKLTARLATAEDELDVLRQALAQEHQARARAESGDALAQARTELARQAALLEKLSRELEAHDGVRRPTGADDSATGTA